MYWRITAGIFAIMTAAFAVWSAQLTSSYYILSAEIRQMIGRTVPEDDPARMAAGYLIVALIMAAAAGALTCYAVIGRPNVAPVADLGQPSEAAVA